MPLRDIPQLAVDTLKWLLSHANRNIGLRSADTMASCVNVLTEAQFVDLVLFLNPTKKQKKGRSAQTNNIFVVTTGHICKSAGARIAAHLPKVVPLLLASANGLASDSDDPEDQELCEVALQALYSVFAQCSLHIDKYVCVCVYVCVYVCVCECPSCMHIFETVYTHTHTHTHRYVGDVIPTCIRLAAYDPLFIQVCVCVCVCVCV
jgi:hypothetical protein